MAASRLSAQRRWSASGALRASRLFRGIGRRPHRWHAVSRSATRAASRGTELKRATRWCASACTRGLHSDCYCAAHCAHSWLHASAGVVRDGSTVVRARNVLPPREEQRPPPLLPARIGRAALGAAASVHAGGRAQTRRRTREVSQRSVIARSPIEAVGADEKHAPAQPSLSLALTR